MATSLIYKNSSIYELVMLVLYGRHYSSRYRVISDLVPAGSSVLDLCCGPAILYSRYLRHKSVRYTGVDLNANCIEQLLRQGGDGKVWDLRRDPPLPGADYCIMQASLYHFLPDPSRIVDRMLEAAGKQVIIAEPVRNLATNRLPLLRALVPRLTNPGDHQQSLRFTEQSLDSFFTAYESHLSRAFLIPGGREKVYVLTK